MKIVPIIIGCRLCSSSTMVLCHFFNRTFNSLFDVIKHRHILSSSVINQIGSAAVVVFYGSRRQLKLQYNCKIMGLSLSKYLIVINKPYHLQWCSCQLVAFECIIQHCSQGQDSERPVSLAPMTEFRLRLRIKVHDLILTEIS